ncbi:hypothetical protein BC936DRAFT_146404 [Jimgerdemannia flammicorona]|uniref:Homeodomain-like protein n=1 Tax=Jimgerdemannia flammicorona TaxID=994334 RepID=A0A433D7S0_9FUNG|nr:hypothetical protein BC936DRAFT_146404 [Jimgerdemannia flammicorona]
MFRFIKQSLTQFRFLTVSARHPLPRSSVSKFWSNEEDHILREAHAKHGNNWPAIALSFQDRSPRACSSRFARLTHDPKPFRERYLAWTEEETCLLREKVAKYGSRWKFLVGRYFPNRAPSQLLNYWAVVGNPRLNLGVWQPEEEKRLLDAVQNSELNWSNVAQRVGTRNQWQCRQKYYRATQSRKKGPFTHEEDKAILDAFRRHPGVWSVIASEVSKVTGFARGPWQCRTHYEYNLDPRVVKDPWTAQEDKILVDAYNRYGPNSLLISRLLPKYRGGVRVSMRIKTLKKRGVIKSRKSEDESEEQHGKEF